MVRCPGYCIKPGFKAVEDITIDTYITPHEIFINQAGIQAHVVLLVQKFAADVVVPHLHHFMEWCMEADIPDVQCPHSYWIHSRQSNSFNISIAHRKKFSAKGPNHLPPFEEPENGHLRCHCFPAGTLKRDRAAYNFNPPLASKRTKVTCVVKQETEEDDDSVVYTGSTSSYNSRWQSASHAGVLSE